MPNRLPLFALILILWASTVAVACDRSRTAPELTEEEIRELVNDQPEIFVQKKGTLTLEGIEELYLGQSNDEAHEVLDDYCEVIKTFDGGWRHNDAVFKGCNIDAGDHYKTIRVGFWPFNDDRVSTLEIQDRTIPMDVVRARFTELSDELTEDLPRRGLLIMASSQYRLIANWDDGLDEPVHITVGFHPP